MALKILWDRYEAALLIDTYFRIKNGSVPRKEAVGELSSVLRGRATAMGMEIDSTFRNENGMSMCLTQIDQLFSEDGKGLKNVSQLFREMVHMYKVNREKFDDILLEALDSIPKKPSASVLTRNGSVPFSEEEAAILLDAYLQSLSGSKPSAYYSSTVSVQLRKMATNRGLVTDANFRTPDGIASQMRRMAAAYEGTSSPAAPTKLFLEMVELYQTNRPKYKMILDRAKTLVNCPRNNHSDSKQKEDVKSMRPVSDNNGIKDQFAQHLLSKYSTNRVGAIFLALSEADSFLVEHRIVRGSLFTITDAKTLAVAIDVLRQNRIFKFNHKKQLTAIDAALREYAAFIKTLSANSTPPTKGASVEEDLVVPTASEANTKTESIKTESDIPTKDVNENETAVITPESQVDLSFTKPEKFRYFDEEYYTTSWTDLYVKLCSILYDDYPNRISALVGTSLTGGYRIEIGNASHYVQMRAPKLFTKGKYVETNLSATDILRRAKILLDKCLVDYENLSISFVKTNVPGKTNPSQLTAPNSRSRSDQKDKLKENRIQFIAWMQEKGLQSATVFSYLSALNKVSEFSNELGYIDMPILLIDNATQLNTLRSRLINNSKYKKWNEDQHNRFSAALAKYIEYRSDGENNSPLKQDAGSNYGQEIKDDRTLHSSTEPDTQQKEQFVAVLQKYFEDGFRPAKAIDRNRFRIYYSDMFEQDLSVDDEQLVRVLMNVGTLRDERIFVKDGNGQQDILEEINDVIMGVFKNGASCVYLDCLFAKYQDKLAEMLHIYNVDSLEGILLASPKHDYFKRYNYLFGKHKEPSAQRDVIEYMKKSHFPVTYSEIENSLWYIPLEKIKHTLVTTSGIVNVASEAYLYALNLPVSESELQQITELISNALLQQNYISDVELMQLIEEHCPSVLMNTPDYPIWGLRNALAYLLREKFSFRGAIISDKDEEISMAEVFTDFCQRSEHITVDELRNFANELNTVIYWDAVYGEMVRINQNEFIRRDQIHFDIEQTDAILDSLIQSAYTPIRTINLFLHFPAIDVAWNSFVLESYVANYSKKFRLLHASYTAADCCGAVVRQESDISDYRTLIVDVLSKNTGWKNKKDALQLLVDLGYQQRRSYSDIEKVMQEAKARMSASKK